MTSSAELKLVPLTDFNQIPKYLLEQVKGRNWDVDKLIEWGSFIAQSPMQRIFGVVNKDNQICGVVWATVNPIADGIILQIVSVDPAYQDGKIIPRIQGTFKKMLTELNLSKLYAMTTRTKAGERLGWKHTGLELMMEA